MKRDIARLWCAGVVLALLEIVWTLLHGHTLFLSASECLLYAGAAITTLAACVLVLGLAIDGASRSRAGTVIAGGLVAAIVGTLLWSLTSGRRVHDAAFRSPLVALVAVFTSWLTPRMLALFSRARARSDLRAPIFAAVIALGALVVDATVLPRGYPAFHLGLLLLALIATAVGGMIAPPRLPPRWERPLAIAALVATALAPWLLSRLAAHPTAGFAVREHAPWSKRFISVLSPGARPIAPTAEPRRATPPSQAGVDLRDRDVLLITIDALRADLLRAYGGDGRTPFLDELADSSAVFLRAYTPAPHTSYALTSLLTGKFVKPLVALGGDLGNPPTIPDRLRRYGYRTAAFYPPAIFFVDGGQFAALAQRGFGFEYRKEMFAPADERVVQLSTYLDQVDPKRPLFVWVHLFEPHEPYDPPAEIVHDGSARGRYEAEVTACDRAARAMVARFRAARPRATVIVTADHGEEFGEHGGRFHGSTLYDEQARIPLLWSSPGTIAPRRIAAPVELTDVGTSLLSTAGIPRDAHMRGDDLGPVLAGHDDAAPTRAFASTDTEHMITDGRLKAICPVDAPHCALFDLVTDPHERTNAAGRAREVTARMRGELDAFLASIPREEALTVSAGVSLPESLARAKLGAEIGTDALLPLLADARPAVRAEAARVLGGRGDDAGAADLARIRLHDDDASVRAEAAIAALRLGDVDAHADVVALLRGSRDRALVRRAALALAVTGSAEGFDELAALANDDDAIERDRREAIDALARLGLSQGVDPLSRALSSVRLREAAAHALGVVGGDRARTALRTQLAEERYPPARTAEAEALRKLGDARVTELVVHYLGMESGLSGGVRMLAENGTFKRDPVLGALLIDPRARRGRWRCSDDACAPDADAAVVLPKTAELSHAPARVVLWYRGAADDAALLVDGQRLALPATEGQISIASTFLRSRRVAIAREGAVQVVAVAVVRATPEIPPPPPEPWDGGVAPTTQVSPPDASR